MTCMPLTIAVENAGDARPARALRPAAGDWQSKSDVDAEVLTCASEVPDLTPLTLPTPMALRRSVIRRAGAVIRREPSWRRLMPLAR